MRNHTSRLKKLETMLKPDDADYQVIIVTSFIDEFIKPGYFKDKVEQDAFIHWRLEGLKKEAQLTGRPVSLLFMLEEEDVNAHLEAFKAWDDCTDLPGN